MDIQVLETRRSAAQEGVGGSLLTNGGRSTMPRKHLGVIGKLHQPDQRLPHRLRVGGGKIDPADRPLKQGVSGNHDPRRLMQERHRTRAVPRDVDDSPILPQRTSTTILEDHIRWRGGLRGAQKDRQVQLRTSIPILFKLMTGNRHRAMLGQHLVDSPDVVMVTMGQHDSRRRQTMPLDGFQHRFRPRTAIHDPAPSRIFGMANQKGVGLKIPKGQHFENGRVIQ